MTTQIGLLPFITAAATTSQDGDCLLSLGFQAAGLPIDLTGIAFTMLWRPVGSSGLPSSNTVSLTATTAGSYLSTSGTTGVLTIAVPQAKMGVLPVSVYVADIIATADGANIVVGQVIITHGALGACLWTALTTTARNAATANSVGYVPGPGWNQYQGTWSATASYGKNDVVFYGVSTWIASVANTGVAPVAGATWNLVAEGLDPTALDAAVAAASASASTATTEADAAEVSAAAAAQSAAAAAASASQSNSAAGIGNISAFGSEFIQEGSATAARALLAAPAKGRTNVADAAYQILATDVLVAVTALTAARVLTLPPASSYDNAQGLVIVDESGACSPSVSIEIAASGSDTIITSGADAAIVMTQPGQKTTWHPNSTGNGWTYA